MKRYTHIGHSRGSRDGWANGAQVWLGWQWQYRFAWVRSHVWGARLLALCRCVGCENTYVCVICIYFHEVCPHVPGARLLTLRKCVGCENIYVYMFYASVSESSVLCMESSSHCPTQVCRVWEYIYIHVICINFLEFGLMYRKLVSLPYAGV